ncbi:MAG: hypothetical protein AWT59_1189 [Candidatus Gallionella acididurans]|uniref:Uncharacterized protein n=1 Tax=Candidatus Gallionella acididurans TaxID=1796491 RepID=A0A139BUM6_9PROT|nr:MAG: hypothetical protein AWT59_1189 [Candidatus Gallionella acididurans]
MVNKPNHLGKKPSHNVASETEARQKIAKNRNVHQAHEDYFELFFNAASVSA